MSLHTLANPFQGSDSRHNFSTGNTYPAIGVPRGLTYWTPQNNDSDGFFHDRRTPLFAGFRATHQPSPWMNDYGHFEIMPVCGTPGLTTAARAGACSIDEAAISPALYRTRIERYGIDAALAPSRSGAVMQFDYPADSADSAAIVIQTGKAHVTLGSIRIEQTGGRCRVLGNAMSHSGGVADGFGCRFVIEVEGAEVAQTTLLHAGGMPHASVSLTAPRAGVILHLRVRGPVVLRVATSFISDEQAHLNFKREVAGRSLAEVSAAAGALWDRWLERVQAEGGTDRDRRTLYTCLYRVGLWPMPMHEFDAQGLAHHYSPHTGRVTAGRFFTNNGFWDTYLTCYPLLRLIDPQGFGEIVDGFLAHAREGGWLPKWCSPGYRDCMIGSHSDAVIAEAVLGRIGGFDVEEAYAAIRRNAFEPVDGHGRYGRRALAEYRERGFVPDECAVSALSWTLDNAHCDWCVGQVARRVGRTSDADELLARSRNYRNVWDPATRFFRARNLAGEWVEPFRAFEWSRGYVEGGPWQFAFHVPHDPEGLAELHGGTAALIARLETMLAAPPRFEVGQYANEIHEMTEMALAVDGEGRSFGQYAHSNQPVHGALFLSAALGHPEWSARQVERVARSLYSPTHLPGDEDNGEMCAWYVLAALGQAPVCPGSGVTLPIPTRIFDRCIARPG